MEVLVQLLFLVLLPLIRADEDKQYANLFCEVGTRIDGRPDNFKVVECQQWEDTCQTKWEIHEDGRHTIEKVCQNWKGCQGSAGVNKYSCYSENSVKTNNRLCFHCCQRDKCNVFDFVPSAISGRIEHTFQTRFDGSVNFDRDWEDYKVGFGNRQGEFWTGLDNLHLLTYMYNCDLRVVAEFYHDETLRGEWKYFKVRREDQNYEMEYDTYTGPLGNGLAAHNGYPFSTRDRDNDRNVNKNCAENNQGGWWFGRKCNAGSLNGQNDLDRFGIKFVQMTVVCYNL